MYAIILTGGKQYRVRVGDRIRVEKIPSSEGEKVEIKDVLLVAGDQAPLVGKPFVPDAKVQARVVKQGKSPKILIFKKKRRQGYRRLKGHRQPYTELLIESLWLGNKLLAQHPEGNA